MIRARVIGKRTSSATTIPMADFGAVAGQCRAPAPVSRVGTMRGPRSLDEPLPLALANSPQGRVWEQGVKSASQLYADKAVAP